MGDVDAALVQQILHIPQGQRKAHMHHHREANDLKRSLEIIEWVTHALKL
jgi:hypothetical protein|tara:strand:- start:222 stop:371 length:150 start_codon:yes stop_codon:yes gene_type:complete